MINLKSRGPQSKLTHWTKICIHTLQSCARIRKLPMRDHMTHVVKIDILTGHEEKGNLHYILRIIFHCIFIKEPCIFSKLVQIYMEGQHIV